MILSATIYWFDKKTEAFKGKTSIDEIHEKVIREILNVPDNLPFPKWMEGSYSLAPPQLEALKPFTGHQYNLSKYDYFIGKWEIKNA